MPSTMQGTCDISLGKKNKGPCLRELPRRIQQTDRCTKWKGGKSRMALRFWPRGTNLKMKAYALVYSFTDPG